MSRVADEHHASSPTHLRCGLITVSDTRTIETDSGGALVLELLTGAGHSVPERHIVPDEADLLIPLIERLVGDGKIDALLLTGGTGIAARDRTYETLDQLITRALPGYGELFRMLSFQEIGPAAMLSRAIGGLIGHLVVLSMPGSPAAIRLAMERLILPELGHLVREARR